MEATVMIVMQDREGLFFRPAHLVASFTLERPGRCRGVCSDGTVGFRPDVPEGPWSALDFSQVNPAWIQRDEQGVWRDSGGFRYSGPPDGPAVLPEPSVRLEVLAVKTLADGGYSWLTDEGEQPESGEAEQAVQEHPDLIQVRSGLWVNRRRLARLRPEGNSFLLILDNGEVLGRLANQRKEEFSRKLGLSNLSGWEPQIPGLSRFYLRDWPEELAVADGETLRRWFSESDDLIANIAYQAVRYRDMGQPRQDYGKTHEGFMYNPLYSPLSRAGFLTVSRATKDQLSLRFQQIANELVGGLGIFNYHELGFKETQPWLRRVGQLRPEILLVCEKESMREYAEVVADEYGVSLMVTGGLPKLVGTEFWVEALRKVTSLEVVVVALVDFDNRGWSIVTGLVKQLERFAVKASGPIHYLVLGECFSDEEVELFSFPLESEHGSTMSEITNWVQRSGGLRGKARGIHCNHFVPVERILERMDQVMASLRGPQ